MGEASQPHSKDRHEPLASVVEPVETNPKLIAELIPLRSKGWHQGSKATEDDGVVC